MFCMIDVLESNYVLFACTKLFDAEMIHNAHNI